MKQVKENRKTEKIHKYIARCGICSRREAEELIAEGRVTVNGKPAQIGQRIDPATDRVEVDGKEVRPVERLIYIMLNKPKGVVTTANDERGRRTVLDFIRNAVDLNMYRVFPVGRLDKNSTGLIILTNDGDLAAKIINPRTKIPKEYVVTVKGHPSRKKLNELEQGIFLEGRKTLPCKIEIIKRNKDSTRLKVVLYEGKKRQIRRMMKLIKHPVISLNRVAIGPLRMKDLKRGSFRFLTDDEVKLLKEEIKKRKEALSWEA
jgi:pseudouridine synthase